MRAEQTAFRIGSQSIHAIDMLILVTHYLTCEKIDVLRINTRNRDQEASQETDVGKNRLRGQGSHRSPHLLLIPKRSG